MTVRHSCQLLTLLLACLWSVRSRATALDWLVIQQNYRQLEWIAGRSGESLVNGNEWNFAEGRPAVEAEFSEPHSAMADLAGNIYVADKNAHAIRKITPEGILVTVAGTNAPGFTGDGPATQCRLDGPQHAYPLPDGTVYVLDTGNRRIRRVGRDGQMVTRIVETSALSRGLWVSRDDKRDLLRDEFGPEEMDPCPRHRSRHRLVAGVRRGGKP